jgi:hypothetical protein
MYLPDYDIETFRCWNCKTVCTLPEYDGDDPAIADDQSGACEDGKRFATGE